MHNSHISPYKQTAFLFRYRNNKRKRFIITKGYSNKVHLEHPFFHDWGISAGNPLCKPPLALQVPSGKGVDRLIGFLRLVGLEKQTTTKYSSFLESDNQLHFLESGEIILAKILDTHPINRHHF